MEKNSRNALFRNKYQIKSARLKEWDYSKDGIYFITVCTKDRICSFSNIDNAKMKLSRIGEITQQYWLEIPKHYPFVVLDESVIMPNHIHGIIAIDKNVNVETPHWGVSTSTPTTTRINNNQIKIGGINQKWKPNSLGSIVNQYKSICTKQIRKLYNPNFQWQSRFYDHIVRSEKSLGEIRRYIRNNPLKWEFDRNNPKYKDV